MGLLLEVYQVILMLICILFQEILFLDYLMLETISTSYYVKAKNKAKEVQDRIQSHESHQYLQLYSPEMFQVLSIKQKCSL